MSFTLTPTGLAAPSLQTPRDSVYVLKKRTAVRNTIGLQQGFVGTAVTLNSTLSMVAVTTGTLTGTFTVAGGPSATATVTGDLHRLWEFDGTATAAAATTGDLGLNADIAGDVVGDSAVTGDVDVRKALSGDISSDATVSSELSLDWTLDAALSASTVASGTLVETFTVAAEVTADASVVASLYQDYEFDGSVIGASAVTGVLLTVLSGDSSGEGVTTGDLDFHILGAAVAAEATVAGDCELSRVLSGSAAGSAVVAATTPYLDRKFTATLTALTVTHGTLGLAIGLTGESVGGSYAREITYLAGDSAGDASAVGSIVRLWFVTGQSDGVAAVTAEAQLSILAGVPIGAATVTADALKYRKMNGTIVGTAATSSGVHVILGMRATVAASATVAGYLPGIDHLFANSVGSATLVVQLGSKYQGFANGVAVVSAALRARSGMGGASAGQGRVPGLPLPLNFTLGRDMSGATVDSYSGVGTWHPGATFHLLKYQHYTWSTIFAMTVLSSDPSLQQVYGNVFPPPLDGHSKTGLSSSTINNTERIDVGIWDGTYTPLTTTIQDMDYYEETGMVRYVTRTVPGPLRRHYQLADPGTLGGWFLDDQTYRKQGLAADSTASSGTVGDLFVELYGAMYTHSTGSTVVSGDLLHKRRETLSLPGNMAALVVKRQEITGLAAKSSMTISMLPRWRRNEFERIKVLEHHYV